MPQGYKLGKLPKQTDPRTLQLARYLPATPAYPPAARYTSVREPWGMLGNDAVGDCTCAALGHAEQVTDAYGEQTASTITTKKVLSFYSAVSGYDPRHPDTDRGANMLDVLRYWRKHPLNAEQAVAFAEVHPDRVDHVKAAIWTLGFLYIGVALPDTVVEALPTIVAWTTLDDPNPDNGHAVCVVGYDATSLYVVTWGRLIRCSWKFFVRCCDEAYGVIVPSWCAGNPRGLNVAELRADLSEVAL